MKAAIMIIWFGIGSHEQFEVTRFSSMTECLWARQAVLARVANNERSHKPRPHNITCDPI